MIRFGTVSFDGDIAYNNDRCKLKINSGEFERGTLSLTNRFVYNIISDIFFGYFYNFHFVEKSVGKNKILRMDL